MTIHTHYVFYYFQPPFGFPVPCLLCSPKWSHYHFSKLFILILGKCYVMSSIFNSWMWNTNNFSYTILIRSVKNVWSLTLPRASIVLFISTWYLLFFCNCWKIKKNYFHSGMLWKPQMHASLHCLLLALFCWNLMFTQLFFYYIFPIYSWDFEIPTILIPRIFHTNNFNFLTE